MYNDSKVFRKKLIRYYISHHIGYGRQKFYAFVFMLRCIEYIYDKKFCEQLLVYTRPDMKEAAYKILEGTQRIEFNLRSLKKCGKFGKTVFLIFIGLDIKFSQQLKDRIVSWMPKMHANIFEEYYQAYQRIEKDRVLCCLLNSSAAVKTKLFNDEVKRARQRKSQVFKKNYRIAFYEIDDDPDTLLYTHKSLRAIPVPMGGMNKRY